jgi:PTH1 family peptidyl-tRNA hydrolase
MKYTVIGLGNPGVEYDHTPHNVGREIVAQFAVKAGADDTKKELWKDDVKAKARTCKVEVGGNNVLCVLPETFMNNSGKSASALVMGEKNIERTVVVHDDLDLPLGTIRMSFNRGAGGHNGVKSVSRALKTDAYIRLRIGVSPTTPSGKIKKPHGEEGVLNYILKPFRNKELEIKKIFKSAVESLETICTESREKATTVVNSK